MGREDQYGFRSSGAFNWPTWPTHSVQKNGLSRLESGGREGIRTPGLLVANEALSQLSYSPTSSKSILAKARVLANTPIVRKHVGAHNLSRLGRDAAPPITENGTLRVALTAARRARPRAGPRSSWHSGTAPAPGESLPRPSVLVGR